MKTINELQDEVIEEFSDFDDWMDKYQLLIDLGNEQVPLDPQYKTEQNLIDGCQSRVWLQADLTDGKVVFQAESDALIVKGIIALLIKVVSGHTPDEILNSDFYFIEKIGLKEHLSPTRSNGLLAMVKQMRMYALAFKTKMEGLNRLNGKLPTDLLHLFQVQTLRTNADFFYSALSVPKVSMSQSARIHFLTLLFFIAAKFIKE